MFDPNDGFLYVIVAIVIAFVVAESIFFLVKAWKRGKAIGMSTAVLKHTAFSSGIFTVAPAIAILLGVIALSKALGFPLPWLRLSVIGALTYETTAAATAANAQGVGLGSLITDPQVYAAIAWVMTLGIMLSIILVPILGKRIENGVMKLKTKDKQWGEIVMTSLFLGMISAFLGLVFAEVSTGLVGWIPVFVMIASAIVMIICGLLMKKFKWKWMNDYALPISMPVSYTHLSVPVRPF